MIALRDLPKKKYDVTKEESTPLLDALMYVKTELDLEKARAETDEAINVIIFKDHQNVKRELK